MSNLSEEINRQMESRNFSVDDVAALSGISRGQIYRWVNVEQTSISAEQLDGLAKGLRAEPMEHARLLVAHLQDERVGKAAKFVRIEVDAPAELKDRPRPRTKGERALAFLAAERLTSRDVNALLIDLARVLGADLDDKPSSASSAISAMADVAARDSAGKIQRVPPSAADHPPTQEAPPPPKHE